MMDVTPALSKMSKMQATIYGFWAPVASVTEFYILS